MVANIMTWMAAGYEYNDLDGGRVHTIPTDSPLPGSFNYRTLYYVDPLQPQLRSYLDVRELTKRYPAH